PIVNSRKNSDAGSSVSLPSPPTNTCDNFRADGGGSEPASVVLSVLGQRAVVMIQCAGTSETRQRGLPASLQLTLRPGAACSRVFCARLLSQRVPILNGPSP